MSIPTRADLRAAFREALEQVSGFACLDIWKTDAEIIRAAVAVVLGDPANDKLRPTTARHRAEFLALADAIQGDD